MDNLQSKKDIVSLFPKNYFNEKSMNASLQATYESLNPFAIKLYIPAKHIYELWDLTSFRPDILDNDVFVKKLEKGVRVMVLYENLTSFEIKNVEIPRYIIWKNYIFVNVR